MSLTPRAVRSVWKRGPGGLSAATSKLYPRRWAIHSLINHKTAVTGLAAGDFPRLIAPAEMTLCVLDRETEGTAHSPLSDPLWLAPPSASMRKPTRGRVVVPRLVRCGQRSRVQQLGEAAFGAIGQPGGFSRP